MPQAPPRAVANLRQYLDTLPNVATLRDRLKQHRNEGKLLRRLWKLAADAESAASSKGASHA